MSTLDIKRHPAGMWCMSAMYAFFTFAFGGINSVLVLFLIKYVGVSSTHAYEIYAAFNSLVFTYPLIGGYLASRFGYKRITIIGLAFCIAGIFLLSDSNYYTMYVGLGGFIVGYGMCTTACFSLVGLFYDKQDARRESGYTMFYLLFNFGFLTGAISNGYIVQYFGYMATFFMDAVSLTISLVLFSIFAASVKSFKSQALAPQIKFSNFTLILIPMLIGIITLPLVSLLLKFTKLNSELLFTFLLVSIGVVLWMAYQQKDQLSKKRLYAFLALLVISLAFWSLYMLEPSLLTVFIDRNVDRNVFGFVIPASVYYSLDPVFVITLGYVFSRLWWHLGHKGKDLSIPAKFMLSLVAMGIGYLILAVGIHFAGTDHLASSVWIVLCYLFLSSAELLLAPISLSMTGRLAPPGKEGTLMGVFQVFPGYAAILSGYLANLTATPGVGLPAKTNTIYSHVFFELGAVTVVLGIVTALFIPTLKKLIRNNNAGALNGW